MRKELLLTLFISQAAFANSGTGLLMDTSGTDIDIRSTVQVQKQLDLSDPFLVQLFGSYKASGNMSVAIDNWVSLVFDKNWNEALKTIPSVATQVPSRFHNAFEAATLYVYYKNGLNTLFVDKWLSLSGKNAFLRTEAGVALDYVVGEKASEWIIQNGIQLTEENKTMLSLIENETSRFNYSLQAWKALRSGKNSLKWISKLRIEDPLRLKLSTTALIDYAKEGELKASAKLIKEVLEPIIDKSKNTEEISHYYISLARLLYQAQAMDASKYYYSLVPEKSKFFMTARTEMIWTLLQMNDLGAVKGELASLKLDVFKDKFYPEIYLVSAIANLKTCQFVEVKKSFDSFVTRNKVWAKKISENVNATTPELIDNDFFLESTVLNQNQIKKEIEILSQINQDKIWDEKIALLNGKEMLSKKNESLELKRKWKNREFVLDQAIYKMRFVKVEFISRMRELARNIPQNNKDEVSTYSAAPLRGNNIEFPYDGVLWGDEVFNITAQVENLCVKGLK